MKKSNKQLVIKVISIITAAVLLAAGSFCGYLLYRFNCDKSNTKNSYELVYNAKQVNMNTDENGVFRIIKINDTHMYNGTCENDKKTLEQIEKILDDTACDFIVLDGDIVDGFNLKADYDKYDALERIADIVEKQSVLWTFAPGNNDFEIDGSNEDIIAFLMQYDHFVYGNTKGIDGAMQFVADVYNGDKLVHSIAIMDSGARKPKAIGPYQAMTENQASWLDSEVNARGVATSVFFHMPTNAFQAAFDNGEAYNGFDMYNTYPYDEIKNDYIFDDIIKDNENITLISCAHQHSNNMCSFYNNRYYQLSSVSGYNAGRRDFINPSCTLTTINTNSSNVKDMYSFEQIG